MIRNIGGLGYSALTFQNKEKDPVDGLVKNTRLGLLKSHYKADLAAKNGSDSYHSGNSQEPKNTTKENSGNSQKSENNMKDNPVKMKKKDFGRRYR